MPGAIDRIAEGFDIDDELVARPQDKLIPVARAVCTRSWFGSTRFGSRSASTIGIVTMCGDWSATICPHFSASIARTAAPPKRVASNRS